METNWLVGFTFSETFSERIGWGSIERRETETDQLLPLHTLSAARIISSKFAGLNKQFVFYQDTLATSKGNNSHNLCLPRAWRVRKWQNIKFHCGNFSEDDV